MTDLGQLSELLPPAAVVTDSAVLAERSLDWWPLARVRQARGEPAATARAVVFPQSTNEVATVLRWASEHRVHVVPRGRGSGVCGGAIPTADAIVLELSRMTRVLSLDVESQVVEVQAGIGGEELESFVNERGLTLGHYPQSMAISTVGGWIATSSSGQATPGFGSIEDRVVALTAVLADGTVVRTRPFPRSAAGPDLKRILVGAEGTLAVVTEVMLACASPPGDMAWGAFRYPSFHACLAGARDIRRAGVGPLVIRGYDEADSRHAFADLGYEHGSIGLVGLGADAPGVGDRLARALELAAEHGGEEVDPLHGARWWEHRLDAVGLFERVLGPARELGEGVILDTIEVAGLWSRLPAIYGGLRSTFAEREIEARCHFSHVYEPGGALYYTFFARGDDAVAVESAYLELWGALAASCHRDGGTLSHHHGMGRLKAGYAPAELGSAVELLRRVKLALDPEGILNTGVLLPQVRG